MMEPNGEDESDTSSNFDYDSYSEIAEDLKTDTTCLMGFNSLLNYPPLKDHVADTVSDTPVSQWEPCQSYCDRISNRFPDGTHDLISRLGKANYERYLRCIKRRDEKDENQVDDTNAESMQLAGTVIASDFHDSGLGSSIPGAYAETVMSYGNDGDGPTVRVPPLSAEARRGIPFTCVACFKSVTIANNSLWKRHLYEDLCPWMCLETSCSTGSRVFSRRDDWIAHLALEHHLAPNWISFQCPLCRRSTESGKLSITQHLGSHLEEIALAALPVQAYWENQSNGSLESFGSFVIAEEDVPEISDSTFSALSMPHNGSGMSPTSTAESRPLNREEEDVGVCDICEYRPKCEPRLLETLLARHQAVQHPSQSPENLCSCPYPSCSKIFGRQDNLAKHQRNLGHFVEGQSSATPNNNWIDNESVDITSIKDANPPDSAREAERMFSDTEPQHRGRLVQSTPITTVVGPPRAVIQKETTRAPIAEKVLDGIIAGWGYAAAALGWVNTSKQKESRGKGHKYRQYTQASGEARTRGISSNVGRNVSIRSIMMLPANPTAVDVVVGPPTEEEHQALRG